MTTVKISATEELLAVLPHHVGHQLADSVAIMMVTDKIIGPVARTDIPAEWEVREAADNVLASLLRVEPDLAMLVGYESVPGESRSLMHALHEGLRRAGVGIIDHVTVRDGRWWGWCCRPANELDGLLMDHIEGHPMVDQAAVPAVAEFIARGSAPLSSRHEVGALVREDRSASQGVGDALDRQFEEVASGLDPDGVLELHPDDVDDPEVADRAREVKARAARWVEEVDRATEVWAQVLAPDGDRGDTFHVSDADVARAVRSLVNKAWRDALIAWMSQVMFPLDKVDDESRAILEEAAPTGPAMSCQRSETMLRRLLHLARRVPDDWSHDAAAICTVAGCVAWGAGNGSIAGDAVARALRLQPDYVLAGYLGRMVEYQLRPQRTWSDVDEWPRAS